LVVRSRYKLGSDNASSLPLTAYAFVEALVVTPLGALSVVISAILSSIFLNEKLSFFGWLGCGLCIVGSVIIALNGPQEASVGEIREFQKLFLSPGFLSWASVLIALSLVIIFYFAPKRGKDSMLWYISVCSMIGGISVSVTTGLGAAIVQTALGDNQFKYWFIYFLLVFVVTTLLTEVYYLNMALALFNTAMVTPTYYVIFTFFSITTTVILFQGLKASAAQIITLVMGFVVICFGITILQMSKVDPVQLSKLDRKSTILLQAARQNTESLDEKNLSGIEDPGMDALRGSFGTVGSIIRARSARRLSQSRRGSPLHARTSQASTRPYTDSIQSSPPPGLLTDPFSNVKRHQLYDAPMPRNGSPERTSGLSAAPSTPKRPTIKFGEQDVVHQYHPPGTGNDSVIHEHRLAPKSPSARVEGLPYPPSSDLRPHSSQLEQLPRLELSPPSLRQTLSLPFLKGHDMEIRSAPPTVNPRFARTKPDSRDLFDSPTSPEVTNLLSSSSSGSASWEPSEERTRGRSPKKSPRYPRGAGDDDREESESLWQRESLEQGDDEPSNAGGIRLVQANKGRF
jgi:drug/metabolite transporter (DMT)-like permease